jgi:hypothetical protein
MFFLAKQGQGKKISKDKKENMKEKYKREI